LRGSIDPVLGESEQPRAAPRDRRRQTPPSSATNVLGAGDDSALGGLGDAATPKPATPPLGGMGDEVEDVPATPPLGGMGDEPSQPEQEVPQFGITTLPGETGVEPPGTEDVFRDRPLPPERHDLDPYVPIGMKLGTFLLFTEAEIGTILTDNVLATRNDTHSDVAFEIAPDVRLESDWSRHFFSAQFIADRSWYKDFPVEDDRDYQALLRGRLDVTRRTHFEGELGKSLTQEGRDSINLTDIVGNQTDVEEQHAIASVDHTFNRLTLKLTGTIAEYDYEDTTGTIFDPTVPTGVPVEDVRDYREQELRLRSIYEFNPEMSGFLESSINERDYKQPVSVEGLRRGSSGFDVLAGMIFRFTDTLTGEISAGWGEQNSVERSFSPITGALLNADLIWMMTPLTKLEFLARSEIQETTLVDSLGAIDRFYELSLQHAFWRYLVLGTYVSYEIADYVDNPLVDKRWKEGLTAEYYFNPYASVYARYEHTDFISTDPESDFSENEVRLGMRIRH
jgi:hypothetical protein